MGTRAAGGLRGSEPQRPPPYIGSAGRGGGPPSGSKKLSLPRGDHTCAGSHAPIVPAAACSFSLSHGPAWMRARGKQGTSRAALSSPQDPEGALAVTRPPRGPRGCRETSVPRGHFLQPSKGTSKSGWAWGPPSVSHPRGKLLIGPLLVGSFRKRWATRPGLTSGNQTKGQLT